MNPHLPFRINRIYPIHGRIGLTANNILNQYVIQDSINVS